MDPVSAGKLLRVEHISGAFAVGTGFRWIESGQVMDSVNNCTCLFTSRQGSSTSEALSV
jgi:hypothetical protein